MLFELFFLQFTCYTRQIRFEFHGSKTTFFSNMDTFANARQRSMKLLFTYANKHGTLLLKNQDKYQISIHSFHSKAQNNNKFNNLLLSPHHRNVEHPLVLLVSLLWVTLNLQSPLLTTRMALSKKV